LSWQRALAPAAGIAAAVAMLAAGANRESDLHQRLQEARLVAELSCGRPTVLASGSSRARSLERFDWTALLESAAAGAPHERWQAIEILGERGDVRAVPTLLRALADPRGTVRPCLAAQSLGRLGDTRALDALIEAAGQDGNEDLRLCAVKSLGLLRATRAIPVLIERVRERDMLVAAAHALARIGAREGAEAVIHAARDASRAPYLVEPLGEFGLDEVEPALRRLATSHDVGPGARHAAREGLWKLTRLLEEDREAALAQVLRSEQAPERREWAAWRLGDEGLASSAEALATALGDPSDRVAMAAAAALLRFGPPSEPSLLRRASEPGPGRHLAVAALGIVGTERSAAWLASAGGSGEIGRLAKRSAQWLRARGFGGSRAIALVQ
jgi:HEAT repeat protein